MWRNVVTLDDAVIAVSIIELSMNTGFALSENAVAHIDFPDDPEQDYINNRERLHKFLCLAQLTQQQDYDSDDSDWKAFSIHGNSAEAREQRSSAKTISDYFASSSSSLQKARRRWHRPRRLLRQRRAILSGTYLFIYFHQ